MKNELNQEQLFYVLDNYMDFIKKVNLKKWTKLSFSGGEPILKKEFFPLIERASEYKKIGLLETLCVMTNGSTMTPEVAKKYVDLGVNATQISVEGTETINDEIRGKGNFKRAVRGAEIIIQNKIPLSFSLTVTKKNIHEIGHLAKFAAELGVNGMGVGRLVPLGRGKGYEEIMLSPQEVHNMYKDIETVNSELIASGFKMRVGLHCSDDLYKTENSNYRSHGCSTPYDVFTLLPNGDVIPCRRMPIVTGNILKQSFFEIFYGNDKYWHLRNQENLNDRCKACNYLKTCRGSGRCLAHGYFGSSFAPDPQCWRIFDKLSEEEFKEKDSEKVSLILAYINNVRTDLIPLDKSRLEKKIKKIEIKEIKKTDVSNGDTLIFNFKEKDLKKENGDELIGFLEELNKKEIKFNLGKPLPRCIFGFNYASIAKKYNFPESCWSCSNMFKLKNDRILFCNGKFGPKLKYMNNEESIREFFSLAFNKKKGLFPVCEKCNYLLRGLCAFGNCKEGEFKNSSSEEINKNQGKPEMSCRCA